MTQGRGNKANDLLQPNFRDASGSPPNLGNAPVGHAPAPSTVRQAHLSNVTPTGPVMGARSGATTGETALKQNGGRVAGTAAPSSAEITGREPRSTPAVTARRDARSFTADDLARKVCSDARSVLTADELADFTSVMKAGRAR